MKNDRRPSSVLFLLLAAVMLLSGTASAAGTVDLSREHSLTVTALYDETPIPGMQFDAYLISTMDEYGKLTVIDRCRDYAEMLSIQGADDAAWQNAAQELAQEILLDQSWEPTKTAMTDATGTASFGEIPMGLYLLQSSSVEKDGYVYSTAPAFVLLPEQIPDSSEWNYHVIAKAKLGREDLKTDYEVIKVWQDDCHRDLRPQSITVSLICDGDIYDTITLPYNGAWRYVWKDLESNHQWTVIEEAVSGYTSEMSRKDGNVFVLTNSCDRPATPDEPVNPTLPQTGQLWWPVPVLIAVGLLFVVIGLLRRRGASDEK